jgi:hypothetical protein
MNCSQTVRVLDATPPDLVCAGDKTVPSDAVWDFDPPTATDSCGSATIQILTTVTNALGDGAFEAVRSWDATDDCGNVSSPCTQTVTVTDTTGPMIVCAADKTVECASLWTFDEPTATDTGGIPTVIVVSTVTNATGFCGGTFQATQTWRASDEAGNQAECSQTVTLADSTAPTIACAADKTVECATEWSFDPPTAEDTCGAATVSFVSTVTNVLGGGSFEAVRTWEASDDCTNMSVSCSQTVTVADTTAPTIVCAADTTGEGVT